MNRDFWFKFAPFLQWWPEVNGTTLRADAMAAITGAIVVLPQGVAFATIAGMPPEYGLYAAMVPAVIAALFGSSRQLVSGPTTAASIVLFSSLSVLADPGSADYVAYALTLTFMVGVSSPPSMVNSLGMSRIFLMVCTRARCLLTPSTSLKRKLWKTSSMTISTGLNSAHPATIRA